MLTEEEEREVEAAVFVAYTACNMGGCTCAHHQIRYDMGTKRVTIDHDDDCPMKSGLS